jgi:putative oxidoreductase
MQRTERLHHQRHAHKIQIQDRGDYDITDALRYQKIDFGTLVLRHSIGGLMLVHGLNKLIYGTEQVNQILASVGIPVFFSFAVLLAEVMAPVMLIIGLKTRLAAFLILVDMFMATLLVHSADLTQISELGGWMVELNALYFFGALAIIFFGAGRFSISKGRGYLD